MISSSDNIWPIRLGPSGTLFRQPPYAPRHSALVRITHWLTTLCFFALLVSGIEILISHPRFYWGETGNVMTPSLFDLPIPASRPWVNTGYGFVLPDQNGWSRNLHFRSRLGCGIDRLGVRDFQPACAGTSGITCFRREPVSPGGRSGRISRTICASSGRMTAEAWSYNVLQRLTYLLVIFVLFPLAIWTGLAMSPAIVSVFPDPRDRLRRPAIRAHDSLFCVACFSSCFL